jgi:myo-inositol-1(or 4)-monophosphatase
MALDSNAALAVAEGLARRAGALLLEGLQKPRHVDCKGTVNLVTEYDGQSEALIVRGLLESFPDHHVVGEEGGGKGASIEAAPYHWYIDPLDGTTHCAHGILSSARALRRRTPTSVNVVWGGFQTQRLAPDRPLGDSTPHPRNLSCYH